ncbi:MAG: helix-turn-helix domain-containing protein [Candidatus Fimivicinus sp.]|nr:TetR/AcrR family transcriptional regulator [Oscillospiraceae bacterium]MDY5591365.1 helix-turn-helix domain-containing protein [Candidatus Fimivicinus sp.]
MDIEHKRDKFDAMREDAIERILSASTQLFSDYGYAATTIQMIADRAKVVPSGIYHYYAGKSELLKAVVDRLVFKVETLLTNSGITFLEKSEIIHFLDYCIQALKENMADVRLLTMLILQKDTPPDCSEKLLGIAQFVWKELPQFEMDEASRFECLRLIEDLFAAATLFAASRDEAIFDRQTAEIRVKFQEIFTRDTVSNELVDLQVEQPDS